MATPSVAGIRGERNIIWVDSASVAGLKHAIELDRTGYPLRCSCRGFSSPNRCYHYNNRLCAYCSGDGTQDEKVTYPRLLDCPHCDGRGVAA